MEKIATLGVAVLPVLHSPLSGAETQIILQDLHRIHNDSTCAMMAWDFLGNS
jgi:hypothetical protein